MQHQPQHRFKVSKTTLRGNISSLPPHLLVLLLVRKHLSALHSRGSALASIYEKTLSVKLASRKNVAKFFALALPNVLCQ